jgi:hypothetical protein
MEPCGGDEFTNLPDPHGAGFPVEGPVNLAIRAKAIIEGIQQVTVVFDMKQTGLGEVFPEGAVEPCMLAITQVLLAQQGLSRVVAPLPGRVPPSPGAFGLLPSYRNRFLTYVQEKHRLVRQPTLFGGECPADGKA